MPAKQRGIHEIAGEGPLYRRLYEALRERITTGRYPVGSLLPTEAALCEEFNLSRYTVREALRQLTVLGLVARRQGSGSQVVSDATPVVFTQSMRSLSELFQYALETRFAVPVHVQQRDPEGIIGAIAPAGSAGTRTRRVAATMK